MKNIEAKFETLLRFHRSNCFHPNEFIAGLHIKAIRRLKKSKTFQGISKRNEEKAEHRASDRLLRYGN